MFGARIKLFRILGFQINIDATWLIIALLIAWSLARGLFPHVYPGLSLLQYWAMGAFGALGLFCSIILHEIMHSVLARKSGLPIRGITLFIFGGVAEMDEEPSSPKAEFIMAAAGPAASAVLGIVFFLFQILIPLPLPAAAVIRYLAWINAALAVFNLIPAFPLDGGRILRSLIWAAKGELRMATRISAGIGSAFGLILGLTGVFLIFAGALVNGIWWLLIGIFLRNAASLSYQNVMVTGLLSGKKVDSLMKREVITAPAGITLRQLVDDYMYRFHYKMFPVTSDGALLGCISTNTLKHIPAAEWNNRFVRDELEECSSDNTISPDSDAITAIRAMNRSGNSRLLVTKNGKVAGILALKDIMEHLAMKFDIEGGR